ILYIAKSWVLGESTLATAAVVGPPLQSLPTATPWVPEYVLYRDGPRNSSGQNSEGGASTTGTPAPGGTIPTQTSMGYGLTNPDKDNNPPAPANDARTIKPVMTVVYQGANDMLHAFRAGPNIASLAPSPCATYTGVLPTTPPPLPQECGG